MGEYIAFLDSDDAYHPEMIQQLIETLIQTNTDLVVCGFYSTSTERKMVDATNLKRIGLQDEQVLSAKESIESMLMGSFIKAVWNKLYPRHLWNTLRFIEGHVYEDIRATTLVLEQCNRIVAIPQPLVYHRERNERLRRFVYQCGLYHDGWDCTTAGNAERPGETRYPRTHPDYRLLDV